MQCNAKQGFLFHPVWTPVTINLRDWHIHKAENVKIAMADSWLNVHIVY